MGRVATVALTVSAAAPDLDALPRLRDTAYYLAYHRGITHSFVGGAILALLRAALFCRFSTYNNYVRLAGLCYLVNQGRWAGVLIASASGRRGVPVIFPFLPIPTSHLHKDPSLRRSRRGSCKSVHGQEGV
jgi:membrane-bound metal-dependent hydrolase YbcI (DUF457 family)